MSDIFSAAEWSATISGIISTCSAMITLQRQMPEEMGGDFWHDVEEWQILAADGEDGSSQNISDNPEPETVSYRVGIKTGEYETGLALVRIGTS